MHLMWFTERQYHYDPEEEPGRSDLLEKQILRNRSFFGLPNQNFDAETGSMLLNQYIDEKVYSEDLGFDGLMLNEHHGTPFCLGSVMDVEAAVLARATKRCKIVLLGNPVPTVANALRLAEELAMIDLLSKGRLVPGWVRGAGSEQLANNANPALNREYFEEGVDFIIKAWTTPGPFRHEGKHFHFRFVNPWVLPLQKPHPPIWIPGLVSPDTVIWCAKKRFPYIALATQLEPTVELWNLYTDQAAREGYQAGPENFGYLQPIFVGDNQARAEELGKRFLYGGAFAHFARPEWMFPPGYNSKEATRRLARLAAGANLPGKPITDVIGQESDEEIEALRQGVYATYAKTRDQLQMIAGTPDYVIPRIRKVLEVLRPGIFSFWLDGPVGAKDRMRCLELLGKEVMPAVRSMGKELGLVDPFQRKPGSVPLAAGRTAERVAHAESLAASFG
ncbi:MAG TPA: LLM class flavin-dependent oxidoreductase [Candidatus Binataceae bacterium]|nr:LLM class flavin-dependent oxidoreductase [Candidatus Binataceae bacterium]